MSDESCCGPIFAGTPAPTAETLLRSRYFAYVRGDIDSLERSLAPGSRGDFDRDAAAKAPCPCGSGKKYKKCCGA